MSGKSLYDKIWNEHIVEEKNGVTLLYIDRHLIHEVTSPQAFEGLSLAQRSVRQNKKTLAVADHNTPTKDIENVKDPQSRQQLQAIKSNTEGHNISYFPLGHSKNGICHVVAPEQGFILPGSTVVCGDSHTATHGAFGAIAFGIGTSEVEHVLASQTLWQKKNKNMRIHINGKLQPWVTAKDLILYIIGQLGTAGGTGFAIEFSGEVIRDFSMAERMTVCNMTVEAGARIGLIAPDEVTFAYIRNRAMAPKGDLWEQAVEYWQSLHSDTDAFFEREIEIDAAAILPQVTWGTSPEDVVAIDSQIPAHTSKQRALDYIGLKAGQALQGVPIDKVFIGSCTNSRIEDLRAAAKVVQNRKVAKNVRLAIVVPGSALVKKQAEEEGLDKIFKEAGFEWRNPGCSMCLGMNDDKLQPHERCLSTSNRNFEGRQGRQGRTHLASPYMVAAGAINGCISDVRQLQVQEVN